MNLKTRLKNIENKRTQKSNDNEAQEFRAEVIRRVMNNEPNTMTETEFLAILKR